MHAILPPSSAKEWGKCNGWLPMNLSFPNDEDSEEARLGTAVHELAAILCMARDVMDVSEWEGLAMSNGIVIDAEMYEGAALYASDVISTCLTHPTGDLRIEQRVDCPRIHRECFGTPDASLWVPDRKILFVWDYKHGFDPVEVFENEQLSIYTSGLLDFYGVADIDVTVVHRIVQPRAFHQNGPLREWSGPAVNLRNELNRLANAAEANVSGQANCQTGEHCKYCKARHGCAAAIKAGVAMFEVSLQPTPLMMSNDAIGLQYHFLKRAHGHIKSLIAAFEAQVMGKLVAGEKVAGWELTDSYGYRKWASPDEDILYTGDAMGIDLRTPLKPVSPAQAEKKGLPKDMVAMLTHRPKTGVTLQPSDLTTAMRRFT